MSRNKKNKPTPEHQRKMDEDEQLRDTKSSCGNGGMCAEGFREPVVGRFKKHVSRPYGT